MTMATSSYYEDLILDTPEAVAGMQNAIDASGIMEQVIPYEKVELCTDREFLDSIFKRK